MKKKSRKIIYGLVGTVIALCVITLLGGLYLLDFALCPDHRGKDIEGSYTYIYKEYPFVQEWADSLNRVGALKDTFMLAPDGVRLHAYYAAAQAPTRNTAVIVHGYTDNAIRMFMIGYLYNRSLNYNILLPDLRNSGLSGGDHIQMGWNDRKDVLQWMDMAHHIYGDSTRMVVHGISMGAATTMMVSGEELPAYVKAFVEDCGYTSVWEQFKKELNEMFHLPAFPLLYMASELCQWKYGWNFKEASALNQVKKCKLPMLFIHGGEDKYVPTYMGLEVYEAKPEPKQVWIKSGAAHAVSYRMDPEAYTDVVKDFLKEYMK